jgi:hypothetical protein
MIAEKALTQAEQAPKQCKLLGATVKGVGLITTVSVANVWRWALIERADGTETHVFVADLKRDMLTFPAEPLEYVEMTRRVGYGLLCYKCIRKCQLALKN